jgi:prevent-host-death family protein
MDDMIFSASEAKAVTAREFQNRPGQYLDMALREPVTITKNGRPRNVILSVEEFDRLKRRDRRVVVFDELSDKERRELIAAFEAMEIPEDSARFDDELSDSEGA